MAKAKAKTKTSLSSIQEEINKQHAGTMKTMNEMPEDVDRIPTGVMALDIELGGGIPKGTIAEFIGPAGGGKSAIATYLTAQAQKEGECVYIDLENSVDRGKFERAGIDTDRLFIAQPGSSEKTLELIENCLEADDVSCIVLDSVAAMTPLAEINGDFGDSIMGVQAKLMSQGLRKLNNKMIEVDSQVIIAFVNQYRKRMQTMGNQNPNIPTGGEALAYYASTRIEVNRKGNLTRGDDIYGQEVKFKILKNKFAPPFKTGEFEIHYEYGISNEAFILDQSLERGLIKQSGSWFADATTGESLAQGRAGVCDRFRIDVAMMNGYAEAIIKDISSST